MNPNTIITGGKSIVVTLETFAPDGSAISETVLVRKLKVKDLPALSEILNDEIAMSDLYCDKPTGWAETLTRESVAEIIVTAEELNSDFFNSWAARQWKRMEGMKPGAAQEVMAKVTQEVMSKSASLASLPIPRSLPSAAK